MKIQSWEILMLKQIPNMLVPTHWHKRDNCLPSNTQTLSENGTTLKGKTIAPKGSKFILFRKSGNIYAIQID